MVRDVQAASSRLPPEIVLRVVDYDEASVLQRALAGIDAHPRRGQNCLVEKNTKLILDGS